MAESIPTPEQAPKDVPPSSDDNMWDDTTSTASPSPMLCCGFNQDGGCLAIGTNQGFAIHNVHPHQVSVRRELQGGIGMVEMLFRCNLMALVGGGPSPHAPSYRVLIWDDHVQKAIGELSFRQVVLGVRLRRDSIAVALRDRVYVYHLADLSLRDKIYTADNPHGLLSLSSSASATVHNDTSAPHMILACPSVTEGHVRVELYGLRKTVLLEAHESSLRNLLLTSDGTRLATSSVKGTVIRVWDVTNQICLHEFRRGVERVQMTCLAWSWDHEWLACTSDKGTAHIFHVDVLANHHDKNNGSSSPDRRARSSPARSPALSSSLSQRVWNSVSRRKASSSSSRGEEKSVVQIRGVPEPLACAFVPDRPHTLSVVGRDADGNGVLALSDFSSIMDHHLSSNEATRVAYHVVAKTSRVIQDIYGRNKRWRAPVGGEPVPAEEPHGKLYVGERLEVLENKMNDITFDEEEGFVSVSTGGAKKNELAATNSIEVAPEEGQPSAHKETEP